MIKINLLAVERKAVKKSAAGFDISQKMTAVCSLVLVAGALFVGWRYWSLGQESTRLDTEILSAQNEAARLKSIIVQVQEFEQQTTQLQQRVSLIEQLRRDQTGPVHMLDQISRALPPMLWLTDLKQGTDPNEVVIGGRCTTLTGLSDFVANLEQSGYFKRSVEIVSSEAGTVGAATQGDLVTFSIRAQFQQPNAPPPPGQAAPAAKPVG